MDLALLLHERALLAPVQHPNVLRIQDAGESDGCAWLAMEYFERGDLRAVLAHLRRLGN